AISPKKTWEGSVAGLAAAVVAATLATALFYPPLTVAAALLLGLAVGVAGQLGDLFESMLKRSAGIKDSSHLLPGHGGLLDRLDSLIFAAPAFYYLVVHWSPR
ncbi:MAG: phosphatidate cytidylyltransferase, partial [Nitrospirae bacterium CG_4_10_14_3_um_filter_70_108]